MGNPLASIFFHINDLKCETKSNCNKIHLIFSAKSKEELLFKDAFEKVSTNKDFSTEYILTNKNERINETKLGKTLKYFSDTHKVMCFLCGPPKMIEDMTRYLVQLKIPQNHIFFELWW